jgi:nucleoside-diphosphate-sugar epimerase
MISRALVTGGAGFIGANLVDRLIDDGAEVLVVDDLSRGRLERLTDARRAGHVQIHQLDVRDEAFHDAAARFEPDVVFHLAAQIDVRRSVDEPGLDASVNVAGTVNVLAGSVAAGVKQFVFASSGGAVFGEASKLPTPESAPRRPMAPYGVSKLVADEYLRYFHTAHGLNYASLGFSNVYGPRQDPHGEAGVVAIFTRTLLDGGRPVIFGDGSQRRDYVFVEDVTDACIRAAGYTGGTYLNVGTGVETSVLELFELLCNLTGKAVDPVFSDPRAGEVARSALDASQAGKALGWEPWTSLEDGLEATVEWFQAQGSG